MIFSGLLELVPWTSVGIYASIFLGAYLVYFVFIKPFLSPLRKIPGLPFYPLRGNMGRLMTGEAMESTIGMIREYGPLVRYYFMFGMERLMVADPVIMKHILVTNCKNYVKPPSRFKMLEKVLGRGLVTLEGNDHTVHKRLISPSFNQNSIKMMMPVFSEMGEKLADHWTKMVEDNPRYAVPIHSDLCRTTLDIIGKTAFGYEFNGLKNPNHEVSQAFQRIISGSGLNWRFFVPFYFQMPFPDVLQFKSDLKRMHNTVDSIITKKRDMIQKGTDLKQVTSDVLGMMMMARDEDTGIGLTDIELRDEVNTIMLAGHETTAVSLAWLLLVLAENPEIQIRVREEILKVFPDENMEVTWERLEELTYCTCVMKETLRMYPSVPLTLRQALNSDMLHDYYIPKGTILLMAIGPMMRRKELFEDPDTFHPERFYNEATNRNLYTYMPFLIGHRMCLGYKFAQLEIKAIMVSLLRKLEFLPIDGIKYTRLLRTTMRPNPALTLRVKPIS